MSARKEDRGPVQWMAKNSVAANLLMFVIIVAGFVSILQIKQEIFPDFALDIITIQVAYPGAGPEEVEQGIVLAVEEAVQGIEGVDTVTSTSAEGVGAVMIELLSDANPDRSLSDIKNAIDQITTFPEEAEEPKVSLAEHKRQVLTIILSGDQDLRTLHDLAETIRAELLSTQDVSQVDIMGVPGVEISIDIDRDTLESYNLTLQEVAQQIKNASLELPSGEIKTDGGYILVRLSDRRKWGNQFSDIIIRGTSEGANVRLGDIATIIDDYEDTDMASYFNGQRAVFLDVYRIGDETPIDVATATKKYLAQLEETLPDNISISLWNDRSIRMENRINLLFKNAIMGMILILILLGLFLKARLAFWVALGMPISYLGSFIIMKVSGYSINMISLFGFIVVLGMVVDDAIVVSENVFYKLQQGKSKIRAAIEGAQEMTVPVVFSILTTIVAFMPLMYVPGILGKIFFVIPIVVISVLALSLFESFLILPAHLGHGKDIEPGRILGKVETARLKVSGWLEVFTEKYYKPAVTYSVDHRGIVLSIAFAIFIVTVGAVASGVMPFNFFPDIQDDEVTATIQLPYGTPVSKAYEVKSIIEKAAKEAIIELNAAQDIEGMLSIVGQGERTHGGAESGSHLLTVEVALDPADERDFSSREFARLWSQKVPEIAGVVSMIFNSAGGPSAGAAVDVQLSHINYEVLEKASIELTKILEGYPQLRDVENSFSAGKTQFDFHLLPVARNLGLTGQEIASQVRAGFYGAEALREQRGRNEIKVMVRLPEDQRQSEYDLQQFKIRTPEGGLTPLSYVATFERGRAPTVIRREDGRRIVNVNAKLAPGVASPRPILQSLAQNELKDLKNEYSGLITSFAGRQKEQTETFDSLISLLIIAAFAVFALLAIPLRSYIQPVVIMAAIPFGFVGAVLGHALMMKILALNSVLGIIALSGVVVNDTLVLVVAANTYRDSGDGSKDAIIRAGIRRLRPILLTSLTTFFGLMPMIFETDMSAQFLIPMAISLGFGIIFSLPVALLLVPAFYMTVEDIKGRFSRKKVIAEPTVSEPDDENLQNEIY